MLDDLVPIEREVRGEDDRWYQRRLLPYRTEDDRIAGVVLVLSEITRIKEAADALAVRERQQATLKELGLRALHGVSLDRLFREAVETTARVLDVELCKILELDDEGLLLRAGVGWDEGLEGKAHVPSDLGSQGGFTLRSGVPIVVEDLETEERFSGPQLLVDHGVVSGLSVPISGGEGPWGVMGAHTREPRRFGRYEVDFLQNVANLLASAIDRARTEEKMAQSEARERQRAQELSALTSSVPAAVWFAHDPGAQKVSSNPAAYRLLSRAGSAESRLSSWDMEDRPYRTFHDGRELTVDEAPLRRSARGEIVEGISSRSAGKTAGRSGSWATPRPSWTTRASPGGAWRPSWT